MTAAVASALAEALTGRFDDDGMTAPFAPVEGENLWLEWMPDQPDESVCVWSLKGRSMRTMNGVVCHRMGAMVAARAAGGALTRAFELARGCRAALELDAAQTAEGLILGCSPDGEPVVNSWDSERRPLVAFTLEVWLRGG